MLNTNFDDQVLYIEGNLQVHHLDNIKDKLVALVAEPGSITVDLSQVEEVDVAGLQMLLAFLTSRKGASKLSGVGMELSKAIDITGLDSHFAKFV